MNKIKEGYEHMIDAMEPMQQEFNFNECEVCGEEATEEFDGNFYCGSHSPYEDEYDDDDEYEDHEPEDHDISGTEEDYVEDEYDDLDDDEDYEPEVGSLDSGDGWDEYEDDDDDWDDLLEERITNRLELQKKLNESIRDAIKHNRLREENENPKSTINGFRYKLQQFTNGGSPSGFDENGNVTFDGKKGEPSAYEKKRYEKIMADREKRKKQEEEDSNSSFASPKHTKPPKETWDNQEDELLGEYVRRVNERDERLKTRIDNFLNWSRN